MTPANRNRLLAVAALFIAGGALAWVSNASVEESLVYYWTPTELKAADNAEGAIVRLGGMVVPGSVDWDKKGAHIRFQVTDGSETVTVDVDGNPPQMFREGIGVVVEGELAANGTFESERVMVKHSNEYESAEEGDHAESWKNTVAEGD